MAALSPYTQDPSAGPYMIFPNHAQQILSNCVHILGVSILAYCFARRTDQEFSLLSMKNGWANISWTRLCVILLFIDSWIFLAFSGILVNGVGLSYSTSLCSLGIYACIIFYAGSKALIYSFLAERVWIIWICLGVVFGYIAIFALMIVGQIAFIRSDGMCLIGLKTFASISLLSYDLFVNVFLTSLFVWPLCREKLMNRRLRGVTWRTLLASAVALTTSSVNMFVLTMLHGRQLGWVCLASCATDVTINALVIFWVTASAYRENIYRNCYSLPPLHPYPSSDNSSEVFSTRKIPDLSKAPIIIINGEKTDSVCDAKFRDKTYVTAPSISVPTPMVKAHFEWVPRHCRASHDLTLLSPINVGSHISLTASLSPTEFSPLPLDSSVPSPVDGALPLSACSSSTLCNSPEDQEKYFRTLNALNSMFENIEEEAPDARSANTSSTGCGNLQEIITIRKALSDDEWASHNDSYISHSVRTPPSPF